MRVTLSGAAVLAAWALSAATHAAPELAPRALVYCPVGIDDSGCNTVVKALAPLHADRVDRGYDGRLGTVDLRTVDLGRYAVIVIPSLADGAGSEPYALLRDAEVAGRLKTLVIGRFAIWSGTPDQGSVHRIQKDALIRGLAEWAGAGHARVRAPGLVVLQDNSERVTTRYDWLARLVATGLVQSGGEGVSDSVRTLDAAGEAIVAPAGSALAYTNMASVGFRRPLPAGLAASAEAGGEIILLTSPGGNPGNASVTTEREAYAAEERPELHGTGWPAGERIIVTVHAEPRVRDDVAYSTTADAGGTWQHDADVVGATEGVVRFVVSAVGASGRRAQTTFSAAGIAPPGAAGSAGIKVGSITVGTQSPKPVIAGGIATYPVTVKRGTVAGSSGAFNATLTVSSGLPPGATASFSPNPIVFATSQASGTSTMQVATTLGTTLAGTSPFVVRAANGASDTAVVTTKLEAAVPNVAPIVAPIAPRSVAEKQVLSFTAVATDSNAPPQVLKYALVGAPTGAVINATSGAVTWTPTEAQGPGTYSFTVRATDNAVPPLYGDGSVTVTVTEVNSAPVVTALTARTVNEKVLLTVAATATDADLPANVMTWSLTGAPAGMTIDAATGVITWTPTESQGGLVVTVTVRATDDGTPALSATKTLQVTVKDVNEAPVLAPLGNRSVTEGTLLTFTASATDADLPANKITYSLVGAPTGATINASSGAFSWKPTVAQGGAAYGFKVRATDNGSPVLFAEQPETVTVTRVNRPPVLAAIGNRNVVEGSTLTFTAVATDPDVPANILTFSLLNAPAGASIDPATGAFSWTPATGQGGTSATFHVRVTDNGVPPLFDEDTVTVTVGTANIAPVVATIADQVVNERSLLTVVAMATDADLFTWSLIGAPIGMSIHASTGMISWTPTEGQGPATLTVTVRATDSGTPVLFGETTMRVTVQEVNDAPVLAPIGDRSVLAGTSLTFTATASDADLPANLLSFSLAGAPPGATIDPSTGAFAWVTTAVEGGASYRFAVRVTDDGSPALQAEDSITVTVVRANSSPVIAVLPPQTLDEGQPFTVSPSGSDADLPAQTLRWSLVGAPPGMTIDAGTGAIAWTPGETDGGATVTVTVQLTDDGSPSLTGTAALTLTVREVNVAPLLALIGGLTAVVNAPLTFTAVATDADQPANAIRYSLVNAPAGAAIDPVTGVFSWTPTALQGGASYRFEVRATDDGSPVAFADDSVTVQVTAGNAPPVVTAIPDQTADEGASFALTGVGSDPDVPAQGLSWSIINAPEGMTIDRTSGAIAWTPSESDGPGTFTLTVRLTDDGAPALYGETTMKVTVLEVNQAPVVAPLASQTVNPGGSVAFIATATDADLPAETLSYALVGAPAGATIDAVSGAFAWTPTAQQGGSAYSFQVRATDSGIPALSGQVTLVITVLASPPPVAHVTVSPPSATLVPGAQLQLSATATDAGGNPLAGRPTAWSSSNPGILVVDANGDLTALATGQANITVTEDGVPATVAVTVLDGGIALPGGGTIVAAQGRVRLSIPSGAVPSPTIITVTPVATPSDSALFVRSSAFFLQSASAPPSLPLTLTISYGAVALPVWVIPAELQLQAVGAGAAGALTSGSVDPASQTVTASITALGTFGIYSSMPSLRDRMSPHNRFFGAAVKPTLLVTDTLYSDVVASQYSSITAENGMKWNPIHPTQYTFNFEAADTIVSYAAQHGMAIQAHSLIWHNQLPAWLTGGTWTRATLLAVMKMHIDSVVGRYRGKINSWVVVNEAIGTNNVALRSSIWTTVIGADYIDSAFVWAHAADPGAKLYINDYGVESPSTRATTLLNLATQLRSRGIPIDGIGMQDHLILSLAPSPAQLTAGIHQMASAGFEVQVSELDVRVPDSGTSTDLVSQATVYFNLVDACLKEARCMGVTTWGVTDAISWIPANFPGTGRALMLDTAYAPKAAFLSVLTRLMSP